MADQHIKLLDWTLEDAAMSEEWAYRVYLVEELSLYGQPQLPAILKVGHSGPNPEVARRACERGNARTLVVRYFTELLTEPEAIRVEPTAQRWLYKEALQREWFACPDVAFAQHAINRALVQLRDPHPHRDFFMLGPMAEPTVPGSPIARSIAALRAHRTRALERGETKRVKEIEQQIEKLTLRSIEA